MADYSDLKLPNALFELLKKTATKLHEQQLLFYTGMAGFISLALLTPHNSTLSMTELIHTRIGLHQLMVCLLMMHLHHSSKDSVFSAYLPPIFRWRTIQKSPKSKPYRIRIYPGKIIVATALFLCFNSKINPYTSELSAAYSIDLVTTVLGCSALAVGTLATMGLYSKAIRQDPRKEAMDRSDIWAFNIKQMVVTTTKSIIGIYGIYLPIKAVIGQSNNTLSCITAEGYSALLFGLLHENKGLAHMLSTSVAGLIYNQSFHRTGTLLAPILTHYIVKRVHFSDVNFTLCLPDSVRDIISRHIDPSRLGFHFTYDGVDSDKPETALASSTLAGALVKHIIPEPPIHSKAQTDVFLCKFFEANMVTPAAPSSSAAKSVKKCD